MRYVYLLFLVSLAEVYGQQSTLVRVNSGGLIRQITIHHQGPSGTDTDLDGVPDAVERILGSDPNNPDSDYDGLSDGAEVAGGTDPLVNNGASHPLYQIIRLPLPANRDQAVAYDISNNGTIAGDSWDYDFNVYTAVRWTAGTLIPQAAQLETYVNAVNDSGVVVGIGDVSDFAFRWAPGSPVQSLNRPSAITTASQDVNSLGYIVGSELSILPGDTGAFLWIGPGIDNAGFRHLPAPPGYRWPNVKAINDLGQSVGQAVSSSSGNSQGVIWNFAGDAAIIHPQMRGASSISENGYVLGNTANGLAVWSHTSGLAELPQSAGFGHYTKINSRREVIATIAGAPVLWRPNLSGSWDKILVRDQIVDEAVKSSCYIYSINDKGQMVGEYFDAVYGTTPILLTPIQPAKLLVDGDHDGTINSTTYLDSAPIGAPFRFWINDDDDNADSVADANDVAINGANDLKDFYPVFLDLKQLITVLPTSGGVKYKLKQAEGALNLVYTDLTRAAAFSYQSGTLTTGFGPSFIQPASSATTQTITAAGIELSGDFLARIKDQNQGVILIEGRLLTDKPLVLSVEKTDGTVVTEVKLELVGMRRGKLWETSNKANQIFNLTKKDDSTGNLTVLETEGDATYAVPRNNLYVVADPADNKLKVSLDLGIPASLRAKFIAAAWDGAVKVTGSDAAFSVDASQPANLQIAASTTAETKEYRIKVGLDANTNGLLDDNEASPMEIYRRKDTGELRFATVKGISNAKYDEHKAGLARGVNPLPVVESVPSIILKHSRSFLVLFYYKGDIGRIASEVQPQATATISFDAFASGVGYAEWLTHNSGAEFTDAGVSSTLKSYSWSENSAVAGFFASRTPFALESTLTNAQGSIEFQTATGTALKAFYDAQVKSAAEQALQGSPVGTTLTFPLDGGWYEFPRSESPNFFKSISPGNWVAPSTQIVGSQDGYGWGLWGALLATGASGGDQYDEYDAFATIGRGRVLNPRYKITVKKENTGIIFPTIEYKVSAVQFTCDVEDLYDFNYEDGELPSHAAAMQIGWGKGVNGTPRDQGKIYRHQIRIDHIYSYPFDHTVIVNP